MNIVLGIGVLLAGAWCPPESSDQGDITPVPHAGQYDAAPSSESMSRLKANLLNLDTSSISAPSRTGMSSPGGYAPAPRRPSAYGGASTMRGMMPMAPTDVAARGLFAAPTDYGAGGAMPMPPTGNMSRYAHSQPMNRSPYPVSPRIGPTYPVMRAPGAFNNGLQPSLMSPSFSAMESQNAPMRAAQIGMASNVMASNNKAFSGYRPGPAISPWVNLYRNDNQNGTIDNYTSIVQPQLQQIQQNQQFDTGISELQNQVNPLVAPSRLPDQQNSAIPQYDLNPQGNYMGSGQYPPGP